MTINAFRKLIQFIKINLNGIKEDVAINKTSLGLQSKNLLKITASTTTGSGVDFTVHEDGSVLVNGTLNSSNLYGFIIGKVELKAGQKYILSGCPTGVPNGFRLSCLIGTELSSPELSDSIDNGNSSIFSINKDVTALVRLRIPPNGSITNALFKPMLRYVEIADGTYEPYQPDLQTQINVVKEQAAINRTAIGLQRKNLLKINKSELDHRGVKYVVNQKNGEVTLSGTANDSSYFWFIGSNQTTSESVYQPGKYILSTYGLVNGCSIYVVNKNKNVFKTQANGEHEFNAAGGITGVCIEVLKDINADNVVIKCMLRYAEITDDTYEPYVDDLQTQLNTVFGSGKLIPDNANLDDYMTPGAYYSPLAANSATMTNTPFTLGGFRLEVRDINNTTSSRIQKLIGNSTGTGLAIFIRTYVSERWSSWHKVLLEKV